MRHFSAWILFSGFFFSILSAATTYSQVSEVAKGSYKWHLEAPAQHEISITNTGIVFPGWNTTIDQDGVTIPVLTKLIYTKSGPPRIEILSRENRVLPGSIEISGIIEEAKGIDLKLLPRRNQSLELVSTKLISDVDGQQLWAVNVLGAQYDINTKQVVVPENLTIKIMSDVSSLTAIGDNNIYLNQVVKKQSSLNRSSQVGISTGQLKLHVLNDGIYRITYASMSQIDGLPNAQIESATLSLTNKGKEQPIYVFDGGDGVFDNDDYFDFIGIQNYYSGTSQYFDPFSDINIYWLNWGGNKGLRFVEESGSLVEPNPVRPSTFWDVAHLEKDSLFDRLGQVDNDLPTITRDHYFWSSVNSGQNTEVDFFLANPFRGSSENVEISVGLHGLTYDADDGETAEHSLFAFLNDNSIGEGNWVQQEQYVLVSPPALNLSHDILASTGINTLATFAPVSTEAGQYDRIVMDWIEIGYEHLLIAEKDALRFRKSRINPATALEYEISDFSSPNLVLYKQGVSKITGYSIREIWDSHNPTFNLVFQDQATNATPDYWASNVESLMEPIAISVDTLASLRELDGDFIIITVPAFMGSIDDYLDFKRSEGWDPVLVSLTDIYDEFNHGINSPYAIKSFLQYANNNWASKPQYVLLIGDAIADPQAAKQDTELKNIPTFYMQTYGWGAAEADYWYALINGDDYLPDLNIGRLPCSDLTDLDVSLTKLINYGQGENYGSWQNELIMIAGFESTFKAQSQGLLRNEVPKGYMPSRLYIDRDSEGKIFWGDTDSLVAQWNDGKLLINFLGHGGGAVWADRSLFVRDDINFLDSEAPPAFVTSMTCFTASFAQIQGLGEVVLTQSPSGSIGWFGSSGVGWIINDYLMVQPMLRRLLEEHKPVGELINTARVEYFIANSGYDYLKPSMLFQYNFLGDPTTRLALPVKDDLLTSPKDIYTATEQLDVNYTGTESGTLKLLPVNANGDPWWAAATSYNTGTINRFLIDQEDTPPAGESRTIFTLDRGPDSPAVQGFAAYSIAEDWFEHRPPTADELESTDSIPIRVKYHSNQNQVDSMVIAFIGSNNFNYDLNNDGEWWSLSDTIRLDRGYGNTYYYFSAYNADTLLIQSSTYRLYLPADLSLSLNAVREGAQGNSCGVYIDYTLAGMTEGTAVLNYTEVAPGYQQSFVKDVLIKEGHNSLFIPSYFGSGEVEINSTVELDGDINPVDNHILARYTPSYYQILPGLGVSYDGVSSDTLSLWSDGYLFSNSTDTAWFRINTYESGVTSTSGITFFQDSTVFTIEKSSEALDLKISYGEQVFLNNPYIGIWQLLNLNSDQSFKVSYSGIIATGVKQSVAGPTITSTMMEGQLFYDGDYVLENSHLNLIAEDDDGFAWSVDDVDILLDGSPVEVQLGDTTESAKVISITSPLNLAVGLNQISYRVKDAIGNWSEAITISAEVTGDPEIIDYGNFPNPFKGETLIIYELTQPLTEVVIEIYTLSGFKLFSIDEYNARVGIPLGAIGYHEVPWNGRDQFEDFVANGVYYYRIIGKLDEEALIGPVGKMVKSR